jgi:two-component sensor histidine kinase
MELFVEARHRVSVMASIHEALYRSTTLCSFTGFPRQEKL